jgi:hypothetical protein
MAKVNEDWQVLRRGSFDRLEPNLWTITGDPVEVLRRVAATV